MPDFSVLSLKAYYIEMDEERIWLLIARRISGEATHPEIRELDEIFKMNPHLQYAFSIIQEVKGASAKDYGLSEGEEKMILEGRLGKIDTVLSSKNKGNQFSNKIYTRKGILWAAACTFLLITISAAYYLFSGKKESNLSIIQNTPASDAYFAETPTSITLQDGTKVWLNSGSTLKCTPGFGNKKREVRLIGEAYFDVARNANSPFIVEAGSFMEVKVLGTAFNVEAYPGDPFMETSLISGKIAITVKNHPVHPIILKPHEKITFYLADSAVAETNIHQRPENPVSYHINRLTLNPVNKRISELGWMRGELAFNDMKFSELAYDLERIYHVNMVLRGEQIKDYHLTGVFKGESLSEVLHALQVTTPFQYKVSGNEVVIYR